MSVFPSFFSNGKNALIFLGDQRLSLLETCSKRQGSKTNWKNDRSENKWLEGEKFPFKMIPF